MDDHSSNVDCPDVDDDAAGAYLAAVDYPAADMPGQSGIVLDWVTALVETVLDPEVSEWTADEIATLGPGIRMMAQVAADDHADAELNFADLRDKLGREDSDARARARLIVLGHLRLVSALAREFDVDDRQVRELLAAAQRPVQAGRQSPPAEATVTALDHHRHESPTSR